MFHVELSWRPANKISDKWVDIYAGRVYKLNMKKDLNETQLICDACGKMAVKKTGEMYFGGHPFNEWVRVSIAHQSSVIPRTPDEHYDYCSKECCAKDIAHRKPSRGELDICPCNEKPGGLHAL